MGCFHRGEAMFRGPSRTESNAKATVASSEAGNVLPCFAPTVLFSFSFMVPGIHWDFWPQQQKTSFVPASFTLPHFFRFWGGALMVEAIRKEEELGERQRYWGSLLLPVPFRFRYQVQLLYLLLVHQLRNGII